jgi:uncharacterized protein
VTHQQDLPAGAFSSWLRGARQAQIEDGGSDVPCGGCTACCTSSYFVHIRPEEADALVHIPRELLVAAPGLPKGHVVMGYDESGRCPMVRAEGCSIYEHRPLTCRAYDCRLFAAAGIATDRAPITLRARRWKFAYPTRVDRGEHAAVRAAARFVSRHPECLPDGALPGNPAHVADLAIKVYEVFLDVMAGSGHPGHVVPDAELVDAVVAARRGFEVCRARRASAPVGVPCGRGDLDGQG